MNAYNNSNIVPDCQQTMPENTAWQSLVELYTSCAAQFEELPKNPRICARLRKEALQLEKECASIAEENKLGTERDIWQDMLKYHSTRNLPLYRHAPHVSHTEAEALKIWISAMNDFIMVQHADELRSIFLSVTWKKHSNYGWNPTCHALIAGVEFTGRTPVNSGGYCKLSSAVDYAIRDSVTVKRFLVKHWNKIKNCYGVNAYNGFPHMDFAGKGISELEEILTKAGWKNASYNYRIHIKGEFSGALYSQN